MQLVLPARCSAIDMGHQDEGGTDSKLGSHTYGSVPRLPSPCPYLSLRAWPRSWTLCPRLSASCHGAEPARCPGLSLPSRFTCSAVPLPAPAHGCRHAPSTVALGPQVSLGWGVESACLVLASRPLGATDQPKMPLFPPGRTATILGSPRHCQAPGHCELSGTSGL